MRRAPLVVIFFTILLDLIGFGIILPLLPLYARDYGANGLLVGLLMSSYSLMQFVFAPIWGRLSDRHGRRPLLLMSTLGNALALTIFAFADNYWWLLAARTVAGICTANLTVAQAYIADVTTLENRAKGMGLVGAAFGLGFVIGPYIGGELSQFGLAAPPLFAAGLGLVNFVMTWVLVPESLPPEKRGDPQTRMWAERFAMLRKVDGLPSLIGLVFMQTTAFTMLEMVLSLFAEDRLSFNKAQCGRLFAYIGVVMVIVQGGLIGRLVKRVGEARLVWVGIALISGGMLAMAGTPSGHVLWLGVCITAVAFGQGIATPSLSSAVSRLGTTTNQGAVLGLSQSASALARVVGPAAAGLTFDHHSTAAPLMTGGLLMALAAVMAVLVLARPATRANVPACSGTPSAVAPER